MKLSRIFLLFSLVSILFNESVVQNVDQRGIPRAHTSARIAREQNITKPRVLFRLIENTQFAFFSGRGIALSRQTGIIEKLQLCSGKKKKVCGFPDKTVEKERGFHSQRSK